MIIKENKKNNYKGRRQVYLKNTKVIKPYGFQRWYELVWLEWISDEEMLTRERIKSNRWWWRRKVDREKVEYYLNHSFSSLKEIAKQLKISYKTLLNIKSKLWKHSP